MKYRKRLLEPLLEEVRDAFPVIVLTGARQVGKSTLLQHLNDGINSVTFDPVVDVGNARADPELFLRNLKTPALLDEIQYAPELLPVIKRLVDKNRKPGQYWLTGSQNLQLLKNVSESLAGRAIVLTLEPMTLGELCGYPKGWFVEFLRNPTLFLNTKNKPLNSNLYESVWRGGYPGLIELSNNLASRSLDSYVKTYIERDVRLIAEVSDLQEFHRFVRLVANLTACEINFSELGREIGVTPQTAKRWLQILKATHQWVEIEPYFGNSLKRIAGKSKGYFIDTGMACHLRRISSPGSLEGYPGFGNLFETYVGQDLIRQIGVLSPTPNVYHWRTHAGAEVDLIFELDNTFYPVEIKAKSRPSLSDLSGMRAFRATYPKLKIGYGLVVAPCESVAQMDENHWMIPYDSLLA